MSTWLSYENVLQSKFARYGRCGLLLFAVFGVGSDYYLTHYYHAFNPDEGKPYVIDWSAVGRPRCQMLLIPNNHFSNFSPWTPRNGDVVIAREVMDEPHYMQLLNGRFVERQTCGVALMRPVEEVEKEKLAEERDRMKAEQIAKMAEENNAEVVRRLVN